MKYKSTIFVLADTQHRAVQILKEFYKENFGQETMTYSSMCPKDSLYLGDSTLLVAYGISRGASPLLGRIASQVFSEVPKEKVPDDVLIALDSCLKCSDVPPEFRWATL